MYKWQILNKLLASTTIIRNDKEQLLRTLCNHYLYYTGYVEMLLGV